MSAEKAVKGLMLSKGGEGWGHSVMRLLKDLSAIMEISESLIRAGMNLDKHYIPTRYPNGFDTGAPKEYYTDEDAEKAIRDAQAQKTPPRHPGRVPVRLFRRGDSRA